MEVGTVGQDWSALDYSAGSATDGFEMPWNVECGLYQRHHPGSAAVADWRLTAEA